MQETTTTTGMQDLQFYIAKANEELTDKIDGVAFTRHAMTGNRVSRKVFVPRNGMCDLHCNGEFAGTYYDIDTLVHYGESLSEPEQKADCIVRITAKDHNGTWQIIYSADLVNFLKMAEAIKPKTNALNIAIECMNDASRTGSGLIENYKGAVDELEALKFDIWKTRLL